MDVMIEYGVDDSDDDDDNKTDEANWTQLQLPEENIMHNGTSVDQYHKQEKETTETTEKKETTNTHMKNKINTDNIQITQTCTKQKNRAKSKMTHRIHRHARARKKQLEVKDVKIIRKQSIKVSKKYQQLEQRAKKINCEKKVVNNINHTSNVWKGIVGVVVAIVGIVAIFFFLK